MATLEKIRNRAGTLVAIVIGLALISFILSDFLGSGGSLFNNNQFEIAEISGKSIPFQHYQERVDKITELNKALSGQSAIDEQTAERIREEIWNEIIRENVLEKDYENIGIYLSAEELFDMVQGRNIHPFIIQQFGNPQTGEVNRELIVQFLKSRETDASGLRNAFWLYLEELISKDRLFTKYNNIVKKGLYVTDLQARKSLEARTRRVDFSYVLKRYTAVNDSTVQVTEKEIKDYFSKNSHEFKQTASRNVEYVVFPIVPSEDDNLVAEGWIKNIQNEFATSPEPVQFVNLNSDNSFDEKYYKLGQLPDQELNSWAEQAKSGEVFGPYFDGTSYKLARIVNIENLPDSVKARHILFPTDGQSRELYEIAKAKADSLLQVIKKGGNFAQLARTYSLDPGSAANGGDLGWFKEGMMVKPFNDACFFGKKGEVTLVETQFGFHLIEVLEKGKLTKKVQVAVLERKVVPSTRTYQKIYAEASEFAGINNTNEKFNQALQEKRFSKRLASNLRENDRTVAGLENPRELIRWAYRSEKNDVSPVFEFGENFVVATLVQVKNEGIAELEDVKEEVKAKVLRDKKAEILSKELAEAKEKVSTLEELGSAVNIPVEGMSRINFSSFSMPGIGFEPAVIATATNGEEGKILGPVVGNTGVYVIAVTAVNTDNGEIDAEKNRLKISFQSRASREAYEALKTNSEIIDKRSMFF